MVGLPVCRSSPQHVPQVQSHPAEKKQKEKKKKKLTQDIKTNSKDMSLHTRNGSSREHLAFHHINSEMGRDGTCCRLYYKSRMGAVKHDIFPFQVVFCKLRRDFQKAHLHHGEGRQRHIRLWLSMC